ncbi:TPM domain-containing protein [Flavobacterium sp.]|uniref:TPM domain-containing protein n=1 Tax=Flavobacterium sp. TaxID=239 RepID=UPI0037538142
MSKVEDFLTKAEEIEVVEAIRMAEKNTSGEIRIHLEKRTDIAPIERAMAVFHELKMDETQLRNGVIIYVAVKSKQFAIYGDKGINDKVNKDFWNITKDIMVGHFKNGANKLAIVEGINSTGEQLKKHFPFDDNDIDELSNEISKG